MKKIVWIFIAGLVLAGQAWAEDLVMSEEDAKQYLEDLAHTPSSNFHAEVGIEGIPGSQVVDPRDLADIVNGQAQARQGKFKAIQATGVASVDENGNPFTITPDGLRHSFGDGAGNVMTIEQYIARDEQMNKEQYEHAIDYGKQYDEALKYEAKRAAEKAAKQSAIDTNALAATNEAVAMHNAAVEESRKHNQAEADKAGLTKYE